MFFVLFCFLYICFHYFKDIESGEFAHGNRVVEESSQNRIQKVALFLALELNNF